MDFTIVQVTAGRPGTVSPCLREQVAWARSVHSVVNAYVVPGPTFSAGGQSIMPAIYESTIKPADIDHLVAYLATLK